VTTPPVASLFPSVFVGFRVRNNVDYVATSYVPP